MDAGDHQGGVDAHGGSRRRRRGPASRRPPRPARAADGRAARDTARRPDDAACRRSRPARPAPRSGARPRPAPCRSRRPGCTATTSGLAQTIGRPRRAPRSSARAKWSSRSCGPRCPPSRMNSASSMSSTTSSGSPSTTERSPYRATRERSVGRALRRTGRARSASAGHVASPGGHDGSYSAVADAHRAPGARG